MKRFVWIMLTLSLVCLFALSSCDITDISPDNNNQSTIDETDDDSTTNTDSDVCRHVFSEWNIVKEASCIEEGKRVRTCSLCSDIEEEIIQKSETHTSVTDAAVPANCKNTGLTEGSHCSVCGEVLVAQTVVPKTEDHTPVTDEAVPANCKNTGLTEGSHCSVCGEVLVAQTVVPKTEDHTPVTDAAVPASCNNTGLTEGSHCSVCGEVLVAQTVVPKTEDHTPVTDEAVPANCKNTGLTEGSHCSVCGEVLVAQTVVPKTEDHTPSDWIIDAEATCKAEGAKHKECTVCKKVLENEKIEISATHNSLKKDVKAPNGSFCGDDAKCILSATCTDCGKLISSGYVKMPEKHSMKDGVCEVCGLPQSTTQGLYFGLNPDKKSYYVMIGKDFAGGRVVIGVYNNLSVTDVDFASDERITVVVLGDCVETINFTDCINLASVTIGNRVKEIPAYAFMHCSKLSTISFGDGVEKIGEKAFSGCNRLLYAYISGSHDWVCGDQTIYGNWIGKEGGMEGYFADYLKKYPWEWYRK